MRRLSALAVLGVLFSLLSAPGATADDSAIEARYQELRGTAWDLGNHVRGPDAIGTGKVREFTGGKIYWSAETGAWDVRGAVLARYEALGGPGDWLGFPTAAPTGSTSGEQVFGGGRVYYSPSTGVRALGGPVLAKYLALRGAGVSLGLPTSEETNVVGGSRTTFQHGHLYWSSSTGARLTSGAVLTRYLALGGPGGALGFPTTDTASAGPSGSRFNAFARGRIYWSSATGARWVRSGPFLTKYASLGSAGGRLGLPTGDARTVTGGWRMTFQRGHIYWSSAYGAHTVERAVLGRFVKIGAGSSYVGMPIGDTYRTSGGWKNRFRAGSIRSFDSSGSTRVTGTWRPVVQRVTASQIPYTYRSGCPVGPSGLRRVLMPYYNWAGVPRYGKLIVRTGANDDMRRVFQRAFSGRFPIRRMNPVDVYRGSDVKAMEADNTSAFNCRKVTGNPYRLSQHSYGNAIDINTFENPYVTGSRVYPSGSRTYLNRSWVRKGMIVRRGPIARGMAAEGWPWGARWSHPDYQHFSSNGG